MTSSVKNIIFDFGGVIIDLNRKRCIDNFKKLGYNEAEEVIGNCHNQGVFHQLERGDISANEFRTDIREATQHVLTDKQIDAAWISMLDEIPSSKLDLLLSLRERYVVYLLSNTNEIHWDWACKYAFSYKGFRAEDYFEKLFLSYRMKMLKPDEAIFNQVLSEANILPEETLFIDDSPLNCAAAQKLGIATYTPKTGEDWSHLFE